MNTIRCYFCQQVLRAEHAEQHSSQCGYVLEPCANKCGAYVPRNMKAEHFATCQNRRLKAAKSSESILSLSGYETFPRAYNTNKNYYRAHPVDQQDGRSSSNSNHRPQQQLVDGRYDDLKAKFQRAYKQHEDLLRQIEYNLNKYRSDIQILQTQNHTLVDWRTNVQFQLDGLIAEFRALNLNNKNDVTASRLTEIVSDLNHLRNALNSQQVTLKNEQVETRQYRNEIQKKIEDIRAFFVQELGATSNLVLESKKEIDRLTRENEQCKSLEVQHKEEIENLKTELQHMNTKQTSLSENSQKLEAQVNDLKRCLAQINLDVEVTESSFENIQGLISTQPGRLIWKINDFKLKMENAKSNEKVPIKSPIFYSSDYGYRIRLLVYLNGLKKWRGRHLLACMHVMKGDYDDLLKWPCKIEANILLRDLDYEDKPKDFVRYITAKRNFPEDAADYPQESSTQYIFIPHTTLLKSNFLKNDAVYLEIIVNNEK